MKAFLILRTQALNNGLNNIFTTDDFLARCIGEIPVSTEELTTGLVALLKQVSLDPRNADKAVRLLGEGLAYPYLFGVSNPLPLFAVEPGSAAQLQLFEAIAENVASPKFRAALRLIEFRKRGDKFRHMGPVLDAFRAENPAPTRKQFKHEDEFMTASSGWVAALDAKANALREHRMQRVARMARATAPNTGSWYDLLESVATEMFRDSMHAA